MTKPESDKESWLPILTKRENKSWLPASIKKKKLKYIIVKDDENLKDNTEEEKEKEKIKQNNQVLVESLKSKFFLAANICGLEGTAVPSPQLTNKTIMMVETEQLQGTESIDSEEPPFTKEETERQHILDILPEGRKYHLEHHNMKEDPDEDGELKFEVKCRVNVKTVEDTKLFLEELCNSTGSTFNIKSGLPDRSGPDAPIFGSRHRVEKNLNWQ